MFFTRRVPGQHDTSVVVARLVALPLVCVVSFLFYSLGTGVRSNESSKPLLRLSGENRNANRTNVADFELESIDDSIPDCARDVFVTLHKEAGGKSEHACRGLIIRDDIIVTSKDCSTFAFTFDFAGVGIVEANPHSTLNEKKVMSKSSLGFLEAHPPYHFHWIGQPVRRTRLFLSKNSNPGVNGTRSPAAVLTCGERGKPIAHNFPVRGEMVPLLELEGVVPDGILWEDRDLQTAKKLSAKSLAWWTRPITLEEEVRTIRDMIEEFTGPPGSISLTEAQGKYMSKASAVFEAMDPRGHRLRDCFLNYYIRYHRQSPFSGRHFFDWLDFGPGKRLLEADQTKKLKYVLHDDACNKQRFNAHKVHYFDDEMRARHEVYLAPSGSGKELIARYKQNDRPVPPSDENNPFLYMWGLDERFYVVDDTWDKETYGPVKHTGVVAGQPALSAGKAYFGENGAVWGINFSSGHYRPGIGSASIMYWWMKDRGFNMTALHWVGSESWTTEDCGRTDWEGMKIKGYNATALNSSCHEMTVSPTWILKDDV